MNHRTKRSARRAFSAAAVAAAACVSIVPPTISTPVADASVTVCNNFGGTFNWGIRESFRDYLVGKVAQGTWSTSSDVTTSGDFTDANFYFGFGVRADAITADDEDTGEIPLAGEIVFDGHHGVLHMEMSDFRLKVDGTSAEITVDYVANKVDSFTHGATPEEIRGNDIAIATVNLDNAVNFTTGKATLSGTPVLTRDGAELFIAYEAGQAMDPIGGELGCGSTGSGGTSGGNSNTSKDSKDRSVNSVLKETNDFIKLMNDLVTNTDKLIDNTEKLANNITGGKVGGGATTGGGTGGAGGGGGTTGAAGGGGAKPSGGAGGTGGATGGGGGGGAAAGGGGGGGGSDVCTADGSVGVVDATGSWGVKQSFQSYITGSIAKGSWTLSGVEHSNGQFHFHGSSGAVDPGKGTGTILMPGSVHFNGHNGVLNLKISDLEIQWNGNSGSLIADVSSSDMEGKHTDYGRVALADLSFGSLNVNESSASGTASTSLTQAGSAAFAEFYAVGTELDPVNFTASLGGAASCAAGQGSAASGGAAGTGGAGAAAAAKAKTDAKSPAEKKTSGPGVAARVNGATADGDSEGYANNGNFKIKNANASGYEKPSFITSVLLILAAFVVAGGSLSQLVLRHPASR